MNIRYVHTNIIAEDWQRLACFYEKVFGCQRLEPARDLKGEWLAKGTAVSNAHLQGVHLRLPGGGDDGPTLEIFQYHKMPEKPTPAANRKGFRHLAFLCDDVKSLRVRVLEEGGADLGQIVQHSVPGVGLLTFCYVLDPEGNILELQHWDPQ
jgi:predicted enzyme related to lactoylglutathione lyase